MTQYQIVSEGNYCYKLRFSMSANNSLGMGNWSTTIIGHPIVGKVCVMIVTLTLQHKFNVVCQLVTIFVKLRRTWRNRNFRHFLFQWNSSFLDKLFSTELI